MSYQRDTYLQAIKKQLEPNIVKHSLALEACMGGIYDYLSDKGLLHDDELSREEWLLAGLIHDIDYCPEFEADHPQKTKQALALHSLEISDTVDQIVKAHAPEITQVKPQSQAQWAIFCADSLTGLITAVGLIYPSKKLADVKLKSVVKRFKKQPRFAAGTRRDEVAMCEKKEGLNIPLDQFIEICLTSMKKIASDLGL